MDMIVVIVNAKDKRKKVKTYLKEAGLGDFITFDSLGVFGLLTMDHTVRRRIDRVFDDQFDKLNKGEVIAVMNTSDRSTRFILDRIYEITDEASKNFNTGIAFSIPVNEIFNTVMTERRD